MIELCESPASVTPAARSAATSTFNFAKTFATRALTARRGFDRPAISNHNPAGVGSQHNAAAAGTDACPLRADSERPRLGVRAEAGRLSLPCLHPRPLPRP